MPSKVNTGIRDYLSDQKDKLAEYQRNGGEHKLENANFKFIVHAVAPGATHRDIALRVSSKPTLSSLKPNANRLLAIVKLDVNGEPSGDEIEMWLHRSHDDDVATIIVDLIPNSGGVLAAR